MGMPQSASRLERPLSEPARKAATACDHAQIQRELSQLSRDWGFQGAVYAQIGHAIPRGKGRGPAPLRFAASSANAHLWYLGEDGEITDPNGQRAREGGLPFAWTTAETLHLDQGQTQFYQALRRRGVISGVCVPVADYVAGPAYLSFYSAYEITADDSNLYDQIPGLSFAAQQFHGHAKITLPACAGGRDSLTPREIACLRLGALGHTVAESAGALNVTPRTIEFHLKNAAEKFGAPNKLRAILIAVRDGLIEV
jgi:LuxR family transcriptional activator of conjugal transfer of Ti plasmids